MDLENEGRYIIILQTDDIDGATIELEDALADGVNTIVIDHEALAAQTAGAIRLGNFMHKTSVLSGLGCLAALMIKRVMSVPTFGAAVPMGILSIVCTSFYDLSWQYDPCCKYQEDRDGSGLLDVPLDAIQSDSPLVLVRRDDFFRKKVHNTIAALVTVCLGIAFFRRRSL
eukprot:Colp12_sorted_trinity150504_noHs@17683